MIPQWIGNRLDELEEVGGYCLTEDQQLEKETLEDLSYKFVPVNMYKRSGIKVAVVSNLGFNNFMIRNVSRNDRMMLKMAIYTHVAANDGEPNEHLKVAYAEFPQLQKEIESFIEAAERQYPKKIVVDEETKALYKEYPYL